MREVRARPPRQPVRLFHGHGRMQWPDGRMFLGQYVRNAKHGHGVFTWPDGREYAGQWYALGGVMKRVIQALIHEFVISSMQLMHLS